MFEENPANPISLHVEYLEVQAVSIKSQEDAQVAWFKEKYAGKRVDLIIASTLVTIPTAVDLRARIWQGVPIVVTGPDQATINQMNLGPGVSGFPASWDIEGTLNAAVELLPQTRPIALVNGIGEFESTLRKRVDKFMERQQDRLDLIDLTGQTREELDIALASLPANSIVLMARLTGDRTGRRYFVPDTMVELVPVSNAPVFTTNKLLIGSGIVGGVLFDLKEIGRQVAEQSLSLLYGKPPMDLAQADKRKNQLTWDWRQLKRWKINESNVSREAIVLFKQPSLWDQYRWQIIGIISLVILQALLIVALLLNKVRRKQAEAESERFAQLVNEEHRRLDEVVSNVPGIVWESRLINGGSERREHFVSQQVEKILGYSVEEWLAEPTFWLSIIPDEDREKAQREYDEVFESGGQGIIQYRWITKDGRVLWVESHLATILDDNGKHAGFRGVTLNITERKLVEASLVELTGRLLSSQDEERRRIARELHDATAQQIGVLLLHLAHVKKTNAGMEPRSRELLEESIVLGEEALKDIRTLSYVLHPPLLEQAGLVTALRWYAKGFSERSGIKVDFAECGNDGLRLAPEVEYSLYRVVQECLTNIVRHSKSETASISLARSVHEVVLEVQDRGSSIITSDTININSVEGLGVGVPGMHHRLTQLGGQLTVESNSDGTTVTATVPIK